MKPTHWLEYLGGAPLVLTRLKRASEEMYNLASAADTYIEGEGPGETVEGFFARDPFWKFDAFLEDAPTTDTYPGTRIRCLTIKYEGSDGYGRIALKWHPMHKAGPKTDEGHRLLAEFTGGIETAIKNQATSARNYCSVRIHDLIEQFFRSGVDAESIRAALAAASTQTLRNF